MILDLGYWQSQYLNIKEEKCAYNIFETTRRVSTEIPAEANGS